MCRCEQPVHQAAHAQLPFPARHLLEVGDLLHGHLLLLLDGVTYGLLHALQQEVKGSGILVQMTERGHR